MAVRGINPLEKHIEKIFLALAAAGLTGVVAWQVAGGSGTVKVGAEEVPADQAYTKLESKARQLQAQMREPNPPLPEKLKNLTDPGAAFKKKLVDPVAPKKELAWSPPGWKLEGGTGITDPTGNYVPPNLPAIAKPIAHAFMSTVHEGDVTAIAELAKYMPAKAPFDKAAVSVQTTIDPKAIRAALEVDPDGPGPQQALLRAWWAPTEVVAVELVRQEMKPDGTWGGETATPVLPGRTNFVQALADPGMNGGALSQINFDAGTAMEDVLRPQWYRRAELGSFVVGDEWVPPDQVAKQGGGGNAQLDRLNRELAGVNDEIKRIGRALENLNQQPAPKAPIGGGGGGGGGKRPGGAGGGGGGGGGTPGPRVDPREEQKKQLEKRLEDAKRRKADLEKQIQAEGGNAAATGGGDKPVTRDNDLSMLLSSTSPITVWHHDIDATRGATYHYQIRIKLSNPLYNKSSSLPADKAAIAQSPTLTVPCADWSDPVHVDDEVYCFITSANPAANIQGGTGLGTAQANLMYFTWGYWRSDVVTLEPGDGMVAHWKVPDESKIVNAPAAPPPGAPAPGPGAGRRPGAAAPGGGAVAPAPNAPPPGAAPAFAGVALPTKDITKERDAFLLDVVANPVTRRNPGNNSVVISFMALIRDTDQSIIARDPEAERTSDLYTRLEESVGKGKEQLKGNGQPAGPAVPGGGQPPVPPLPGNAVPPPAINPGHGGG